jgi:hypothetical protein
MEDARPFILTQQACSIAFYNFHYMAISEIFLEKIFWDVINQYVCNFLDKQFILVEKINQGMSILFKM